MTILNNETEQRLSKQGVTTVLHPSRVPSMIRFLNEYLKMETTAEKAPQVKECIDCITSVQRHYTETGSDAPVGSFVSLSGEMIGLEVSCIRYTELHKVAGSF